MADFWISFHSGKGALTWREVGKVLSEHHEGIVPPKYSIQVTRAKERAARADFPLSAEDQERLLREARPARGWGALYEELAIGEHRPEVERPPRKKPISWKVRYRTDPEFRRRCLERAHRDYWNGPARWSSQWAWKAGAPEPYIKSRRLKRAEIEERRRRADEHAHSRREWQRENGMEVTRRGYERFQPLRSQGGE